MPAAQLQRYEQILARLIAKVVSRAGLTDLNDSSVVKHILAGVAREIDEANFQMVRLQDLFDIQTAAGEDLDRRAAEIQPASISRIRNQRSVGFLVFSRNTNTGITTTIPVGTTVKTSSGISVRTTQLGTITSTTAEQILGHGVGRDSNIVAAQAVLPGETGNIATNTAISFVSKPAGVDAVTNVTGFIQGRDEEPDDEFRERIVLFVASLARGTPDALKFASIGVTDPSSGKQVRFAHVFEDPVNLGHSTVYIDDGAGTALTSSSSVEASGVGDAISAPSGGIQTLTDSANLFLSGMAGKAIQISGDANPTNNGVFPITSSGSASTISYRNTAGVASAAFAGTWSVMENVTQGLLGPPADTAVGGEELLSVNNFPVRLETTPILISSTRGTLILGTHYELEPTSGLISFLTPLAAAEMIAADYDYFTGLIKQVQKIIDGDPTDRINFPGYRAAGTRARVMTPAVVPVSVAASLFLKEGSTQATVFANVETAVSQYVNNRGISGDIVRNRLIEIIMSVEGVDNIDLTIPADSITILDDQIARITSADIDLF